MKLTAISLLFILFFSCKPTEVPVIIHFQNPKNLPFEKGSISIPKLGKSLDVNNLEDLKINLKKGKYYINFNKDSILNSSVIAKISPKNNYINIQIREKIDLNSADYHFASEKNIENLVKNQNANFINFGLGMQNFTDFKKKYGIGNKNQGCVISGYLGENATRNNQFLAAYLDEKYGLDWRKDLPFTPYGLVEN